jgi:hypothetical protein
MRGTGVSEGAAKSSATELRALMQSPLAPSAGGPGSLLMDRGRRVAGISGEVGSHAVRAIRSEETRPCFYVIRSTALATTRS